MSKMNITAEEAIDQVYKYGGKILCKDVGEMAAQAAKAKLIFGKAKQLVQYGKDIMNVLSMLKDYVAGSYTEVPWRIIAALAGAVVYVFSPVDLIPDLIPLFGFADDATVFASVLSLARVDINSYLSWKLAKGEQIEGGSTECAADALEIDKSEDITDWSLKSFSDVVHAALSALKGASIHWFCGEENVAPYSDNIHQKIMGGKGSISDVLGVIDMEAFEHCKEGFVLTSDRIYFRQFGGNSFNYRWREIVDFTRDGAKFYINGTPIENICHDELIAERVYKAIKAIINRADLTPENKPVDETRRRSASQIAHDVFFSVPKGDYIFVGENIPEKKRNNAHQAMCVLEPASAIAVLIDGTALGSGKDGIAMTNRALYGNCWGAKFRIAWDDVLCVVETAHDNLAARTFEGDHTLYLGAAGALKGVICEAINKLKEQISAEPSRQIAAKMAKWHADELAMAERYLNRPCGALEKEEDYITAGYDAMRKIVEETTVIAQTGKANDQGCERIVNNVPLTGGWKIFGKKVYVDEVIKVGGAVSLFVEDAEVHFGSKGWFVLDGGSANFKNCRFICDSAASSDSSCVGVNMFCGKVSTCYFQNCEMDGVDVRAAFCLDGDVRMNRCRLRNLYNNRQGAAVLGTSYQEGGQSKLSLIDCSVVNCKAASQSVVWAMEVYASNCEFVKCESPSAILVVNEDSELDINRCVFDQCTIGAGGAVISLYSNGGSGMVDGGGVYSCWQKDCNCQYTHNVGIPIDSCKGWVDEASYKENVAGSQPLFLRDGTEPKENIGADIAFNRTACVEDVAKKQPGKTGRKAKMKTDGADVQAPAENLTANDVANNVKDKEVKALSAKRKNVKRRDVSNDTVGDFEGVAGDKAVSAEEVATKQPTKIGRKAKKKTDDEGVQSPAEKLTANGVAKNVKIQEDKVSSEKHKSATLGEVSKDTVATCEGATVDEGKKTARSGRKVKNAKKIARTEQPESDQPKRRATRRKLDECSAERGKLSVSDAVNAALSEFGNAGFYVGASIPQKKLNNAVASMGIRVGEDVFALIDTTFFGSAKTGLVITNTGFHWKNDWTTDSKKSYYSWKEFPEICPGIKVQGEFDLVFERGSCFNTAGGGVTPKNLMSVLSKIGQLIG